MIISASRRTDIPAYYSEWFMRRMDDGFVYVRNPMNPRSVSKVSLACDDIDGIVFWTKNPVPMMNKLAALSSIPYYFQFTLTPYGTDVEPNVPSKNDILIPAFTELADIIGPDRIIWRYDPIILTKKYSIEYHTKYFEIMARRLAGATHSCTISFLDIYKNTQKQMSAAGLHEISAEDMQTIARNFSEIAGHYNLALSTCSEAVELAEFGIAHARCIDYSIFEKITGAAYRHAKDPNQRAECGCAPSIDIGAYNCCSNGCRYCYANYNPGIIARNILQHDPASPLLIGNINPDDRISIRKMKSAAIKSPTP